MVRSGTRKVGVAWLRAVCTAYVVSEHRGYSFTEIRVELRGPYGSYDEARRPPYDDAVDDANAISDVEILARWDRGEGN